MNVSGLHMQDTPACVAQTCLHEWRKSACVYARWVCGDMARATASKCLFDAFKNYDEAGNQKRIQCLKYLILGKMLSMEETDIFEAPEVKPYKLDPEITGRNSQKSQKSAL